jgi:hypothetical protein
MTAAGRELVVIGVHGARGFAQCAYRRRGGRLELLARQRRRRPMQ